jgi:hypothetical protein
MTKALAGLLFTVAFAASCSSPAKPTFSEPDCLSLIQKYPMPPQSKPDPSSTPAMDADGVHAAILERKAEFQSCFERFRVENDGTVSTNFIINLQGMVAVACIKESDFELPNLHACLLATLRKVAFPKPRGRPVEVAFPFSYHVQ